MAERLIAPVSKTGTPEGVVGSNPTLSVTSPLFRYALLPTQCLSKNRSVACHASGAS